MKIPCNECGVQILPMTAERTGGLCMPCRQKHDRERAAPISSADCVQGVAGSEDHSAQSPRSFVHLEHVDRFLNSTHDGTPRVLQEHDSNIQRLQAAREYFASLVYHGADAQETQPQAWFAPRPRRNGLASRWSNGYNLVQPADKAGKGCLKIVNGMDLDAIVKLASINPDDQQMTLDLCRAVYVCSGRSVVVRGIGPGRYHVLFCIGRSWNGKTRQFLSYSAYREFVDPVEFMQRYTDILHTSVEFSSNELTLHPVIGGTARTAVVDKECFNAVR